MDRTSKYRLITVILFIGLFSQTLFSRHLKDGRTQQRALLIQDFIQKISWSNINKIQTFDIAIMGDSELSNELKVLFKNVKIDGKPVKINHKSLLENIGTPQLVYVNSVHNYGVAEILDKIPRKYTLVIGENYSYHKSMINILDVSENFFFEINETKMKRAGFKVPHLLKTEKIKSSTGWQKLLIESRKDLQKERALVEIKELRIKKQADFLLEQYKFIRRTQEQKEILKEEILKRYAELKTLEKEYGQRIEESTGLQEKLNLQAERLVKQRDILEDLEKEIDNQNDALTTKEEKITYQEKELGEKGIQLKSQRRINLLLVIVVILAGISAFSFFYVYKLKKKSNEELTDKNKMIEKQNKEIKEFAFVASHDLQEPLNTIIGFSDILKRKIKNKDDPNKVEIVELIDQSAYRMRTLIRDLLEYSRLGKSLEIKALNFYKLMSDVKKDLHVKIEAKKADIQLLTDTNLPFYGRETELRLLFQNIISNSLKFSKSDEIPIIKVKWEKLPIKVGDRQKYSFTFSDNGIGIEEAYRKRIFDVFHRLHTSEEYQGTGIGLAHCQKIVTNHGGEIEAKDSHLGGLTICFTLESLLNSV